MRNTRIYTLLVYFTIPVAVQPKTSNVAGIETCSYRESNILCSSMFLIACYYRTYWTGRTDMGKISDTASRRVFVLWFITRLRGSYSARERETSTPARNACWVPWMFLLARGNAAILTEMVRALFTILLIFGRIASYIEIAYVALDRLMHQIIPRTIFACMGIYVSSGYWV